MCVKDLGVLLDSRLNFKVHIKNITSRALRTMGIMVRTTSMFYALVRPLLEYCSCVWSPFYACDILIVEKVQKKFLDYLAIRFRVPNNSANHLLLRNQLNAHHLVLRR